MVTSLDSKRVAKSHHRPKAPRGDNSNGAPSTSGTSAPKAARQASTSRPATFQAGTYNLAAGNETYGTANQFKDTKRLAAQQIVSGEVDVMALQEVGVNGRNTRGRDNNEELLEEVFRQELPPGFDEADIDKVSLDANGRPVMRDGQPVYNPERYADTRYTATGENGDSQNMTLTRDRFDADGNPVSFDTPPEDGPTVVYSAHLEEEDKTYNLAFSSNNNHGSYGNGVLLAPGYELQDTQQRVLGHDPDGEQRSALAVSFRTPDGAQATAISAHLSNGSSQEQGEARLPQLEELSGFADDYQNALIMGDYNTHPGKAYGENLLDKLPFVDPDRTPSAGHFNLEDPDRDSRSIDRIFTQGGDVTVGPRRELEEQGGSDHDLVSWDVTLDAFRQAWTVPGSAAA